MYRTLVSALVICLTLAACGGQATPDPAEVARMVDQAVRSTAAAMQPTATPRPTWGLQPHLTPRPTWTPRPTRTATPVPGIGHLLECDGMFALRALEPPEFEPFNDPPLVTSRPPVGALLRAIIEITNLQGKTARLLREDELVLKGRLNGRWVIFEPAPVGLSMGEEFAGLSDWRSDLPPGLTVPVRVLFDVNPAAEDWTIVLAPKRDLKTVCTVEARLSDGAPPPRHSQGTAAPTSTPTPTREPPSGAAVPTSSAAPPSEPSQASPVEYQTKYFVLTIRGPAEWAEALVGSHLEEEAEGVYLIVPVRWRNTSQISRYYDIHGPWLCIPDPEDFFGCVSEDVFAKSAYHDTRGLYPGGVETKIAPGTSADDWVVFDTREDLTSPALRVHYDDLGSDIVAEIPLASMNALVPARARTDMRLTPTPAAAEAPLNTICPHLRAQIAYPNSAGQRITSIVSFRGTADIPDLDYYKFEYRAPGAQDWLFVARFDRSIANGELMEWHTYTVPPGEYDLRLVVVDRSGNYADPCVIRVNIY